MGVPVVKFGIDEVAAHFGVSKRTLSEKARAEKLCGKAGRTLYFTQSDIEALDRLWHGSHSTYEAKHGGSVGPSMESQFEKAHATLTRNVRNRGRRNANGNSTKPRSMDPAPSSRSVPQ